MKLLTVENRGQLEQALAGGGNRLVLFYSAYCPFCLGFMPAFEKQAAAHPDLCIKACTDGSEELEDLFAVEVVPTILFFEGGKLSKRLDGKLGRGLSAESLAAFTAACVPGQGKK